jgi:hypothetical protein
MPDGICSIRTHALSAPEAAEAAYPVPVFARYELISTADQVLMCQSVEKRVFSINISYEFVKKLSHASCKLT